jgi:hypothetical protein
VAAGQREQWAKAERGKFMDQLQTDYPELKEGTAAYKELNAATAQVLKSDPALQQDYDNYGASRSAMGLRLITDRARLNLIQQKARSVASKRVHGPQPQVPGIYRPSNSGALEDVATLQRQLENATGQSALKLATKLTKARRAAGL